jgi:flagellin-specific chaperone FliS
MRKLPKIILVTMGLLVISGFASAQNYETDQQQRLGYALEKTDEIINRAREVVHESGSERARLILQAAIKLQESARNLSERAFDFTDASMGMQSSRRTLDARGKAQRAIAITRQAGENEEFVRRKLENTEEKMRRLEEQIGPNAPNQISELFDSTREKQRRATELFRNRRLKPSLQMTIQVEKALEDITRHINKNNRLENHYLKQADDYLQLIERINSSELSGNPEVQERLRVAEQVKERAQSFYANENHRQAEKAIGEAIDILRKLGEQLRDPIRIKQALENIQNVNDRLRERVQQSDDRQIRNLYGNAQEHISNARTSFQNSRFEAAASQLQAARLLLTRVSKLLGE